MVSQPFLSVCMLAYNHENFIKQAIDGVLSQKLSFSLELIICDDASNDNTGVIINDYVNNYSGDYSIKYVRHDKNLGINSNFKFALNQCQGQYIAICEGDDYWTDSLKIQKQIDFLEMNPNFSICWTKYKIQTNDTIEAPHWVSALLNKNKKFHEVSYANFASPYCTYTLTSVFRRTVFETENLKKYKYFKDNTLYCLCLKYGKGAVLNFYSSVYRIQNSGAYSLASGYNRAKSNYTSYNEIIKYIPESRVPNIYLKHRIWKQTFKEEINMQPFSMLKKARMKLKLYFNLKP